MSDSNPYTSRKINNLAPTDGIKDPQVRAFCDSLANVWQLRNGNIGVDDKERFITKQEWDYLAKNPNIRALAGIGQPGSSTNEPGPGDGGGGGGAVVPPWINNLVEFLNSGITLIDYAEIRKGANQLWASIYALTTDVRNNISRVTGDLSGLEDDITQINTVDSTSTSKSAQTLHAVKETTETSSALIAEIENVTVTSTSANASKTALLSATVDDLGNSNLANTAAIIQINKVDATSTSASAQHLSGLSASVGYNKTTGKAKVTADIASLEELDVNSASANARATKGMMVTFDDAGTTNIAAINAINYVSVDSTSASAQQLAGVIATTGVKARVFVQATPPPEFIGTPPKQYVVKAGDIWLDTAHSNAMMIWNPTAIPGSPGPPAVPAKPRGWIDGSDQRLGEAMAGVTNEATARAQQDKVNASAINTVWGFLGDGTSTLVQDGAKIELTPGVADAQKWTAVQGEVMDYSVTPPKKLVSAIRTDLTTEVNLQAGRANAAYSLKVEADVHGVHAIAGMSLTANVENDAARTACIFNVDTFLVTKPGVLTTAFAPFYIASDGVVRMQTAYIVDRIQSDRFVAHTATADGFGWKIQSDGSSAFYGTTTLGTLLSGTVMKDRDSGLPIYSTAVSAWSAVAASGRVIAAYDTPLIFYGPDRHGQTPNPQQRVRQSGANNVPLAVTVQFMGVADHYISLWWRDGDGGWQWLNTTTTPSEGYNAVTCGWAGLRYMSKSGYWVFGVSATAANGQPLNPADVDLRDFTLTVTATNI